MNVFDLSHTKSALKIHISFFLLLPEAQCTLWKMTHFSPRPLDIQTAELLLLTNGLLKDFPLALLALLGKHLFCLALQMHLWVPSKSPSKRLQGKSCQAAEVNFRLTSKSGQKCVRPVRPKPWCRGWHVLGLPKHVQLSLHVVCAAKPPSWRKAILGQHSWWHWRGWVLWLLWVILLF